MKNVMIYLHPLYSFQKPHDLEAKIQIDNSLRLGWSPEDILLFTNFPFRYNGITARQIDDANFCAFRPRSTNTVSIPHLIDSGAIQPGEVYWVHDLDAYQIHPIGDEDLGLEAVDLGLTTYGWSPKWCLGSYFLKRSAEDIFILLKKAVYEFEEEDERALRRLTDGGYVAKNRYKVLDISYNFGMRNIAHNWDAANKPLKVLHFHPGMAQGINALAVFLHGKNELNRPLVTPGLRLVFRDHGVT